MLLKSENIISPISGALVGASLEHRNPAGASVLVWELGMKTCYLCGEEKPKSEFHKNSLNNDKLRYDCKPCVLDVNRRYREADRVKFRDSVRRSLAKKCSADPTFKKRRDHNIREMSLRWRSNNKDKVRVHKKLARAIKSGLLARLPCVVCGESLSHGHHEDYNKPLEVIWLCHSHHVQFHRGTLELPR